MPRRTGVLTPSETEVADTGTRSRHHGPVMSGAKAAAGVNQRALASFARQCRGETITPADEEYGEARRVWNGMIDRHPAVIVRCTDAADVAAGVQLARDQDVPLAVRGGGHSAAGFGVCDGGVVLDLARINATAVDPCTRRARVGGGATWKDLDGATQAHGLAVTGGLVSHTGVGGLTLGGGIGNLMRRCGLTCDNLVGADIVTADGIARRVDDDTDPDLMWGLRGGGGNFGVVTRFEYRLHRVGPTVLAGMLLWPIADAGDVIRFYRDWVPGVPDTLTTVLALRTAPNSPFVPEDLQGRPALAISVCWSAGIEEGERTLEPLRRMKRPVADHIGQRPYVDHQSLFDTSAPHGRQNYKRNANLTGLPDTAIDVLIEEIRRTTSRLSLVLIFQLGGAVARVAEDATAYSDRRATFNVDINAQWEAATDPAAEEHIQWVREFHAAMHPFATGGAYVNFLMGDEGTNRVRATYGDSKYDRLVRLKRRFDPDNIFRLNQNVDPG